MVLLRKAYMFLAGVWALLSRVDRRGSFNGLRTSAVNRALSHLPQPPNFTVASVSVRTGRNHRKSPMDTVVTSVCDLPVSALVQGLLSEHILVVESF